jgi:hypothetical protein
VFIRGEIYFFVKSQSPRESTKLQAEVIPGNLRVEAGGMPFFRCRRCCAITRDLPIQISVISKNQWLDFLICIHLRNLRQKVLGFSDHPMSLILPRVSASP